MGDNTEDRSRNQEQNQNHFIWSYFRPRRPLLRPHLVAVVETTSVEKKLKKRMYVCKK